jgi:hypothetical protein
MKRIISMLLIACSAITTASAQKKIYPNMPQKVISALENVINLHGQNEGQTYSVSKNPNTNIIESKERIDPIVATAVGKGPYLSYISNAFKADEQFSYQFLHIQPGNNQPFSIQVVTRDKSMNKHISIRTKPTQEMWFMACKNPENPELRDVYAVVWDVDYKGQQPTQTGNYQLKGTVYMITSLRPDLYENESKTTGTMFDGTKDKVEVDPSEAEFDDFVVDETEPVKVIDKVEFVDKKPEPDYGARAIPVSPQPEQASRWEPAPEVKQQVMAKAMAIESNEEAIKSTYASMEPFVKMRSLTGADSYFAQIIKLNKELDAKMQDLMKTINGMEIPPTEIVERAKAKGEIYKKYLDFLTKQNQGFSLLYKEVGVLTKAAQKAQKCINDLTEKYMKEMGKALQ